MDSNRSDWVANETVNQLASLIYHNVSSVANFSNNSDVQSLNPAKPYNWTDGQMLLYKCTMYTVGLLIVLSNLTVVLSSGLIIKKGQQPKSTYLLLGNVSLADFIIGMTLIFSLIFGKYMGNRLCILKLGMILGPAMVSIFSVGLIGIDRYIYILHGMYHQRWFNTTRVRISIVCIWLIGIILAFMPIAGWTNRDPLSRSCSYVSVYPSELVVFNSVVSIIPIVIVTVLYSIILIKALKNLRNLKASTVSLKCTDMDSEEKPKLRIFRGTSETTYNKNIKSSSDSLNCTDKDGEEKPNLRIYPGTPNATYTETVNKQNNCKLNRSASFNCLDSKIIVSQTTMANSVRSKSTDDINMNTNGFQDFVNTLPLQKIRERESNSSIITIESCSTVDNSFRKTTKGSTVTIKGLEKSRKSTTKVRGPSKFRAVTVVMLTTGSFIITWIPLFTLLIIFEFCEDKHKNKRCTHYANIISGPVAALAFINSILNPLIYAWWHKGFKRSIKSHFIRLKRRYWDKSI